MRHRNLTGCSWIRLRHPDDAKRSIEMLQALPGVGKSMTRETAAIRVNLDLTRYLFR